MTAISNIAQAPHGRHTAAEEASDAHLLSLIASGSNEAFAHILKRHYAPARLLALSLQPDGPRARDLLRRVSLNTKKALRTGGGPTAAFRPYFLTAVRQQFLADTAPTGFLHFDAEDPGRPGLLDPPGAWHGLPVVQAFQYLPERMQMVLWHIAVEQLSVHDVDVVAGLPAGRLKMFIESSRAELIRMTVALHELPQQPACKHVVPLLPRFLADTVSALEYRDVVTHIEFCDECWSTVRALENIDVGLRNRLAQWLLGDQDEPYLAQFEQHRAPLNLATSSLDAVVHRDLNTGDAPRLVVQQSVEPFAAQLQNDWLPMQESSVVPPVAEELVSSLHRPEGGGPVDVTPQLPLAGAPSSESVELSPPAEGSAPVEVPAALSGPAPDTGAVPLVDLDGPVPSVSVDKSVEPDTQEMLAVSATPVKIRGRISESRRISTGADDEGDASAAPSSGPVTVSQEVVSGAATSPSDIGNWLDQEPPAPASVIVDVMPEPGLSEGDTVVKAPMLALSDDLLVATGGQVQVSSDAGPDADSAAVQEESHSTEPGSAGVAPAAEQSSEASDDSWLTQSLGDGPRLAQLSTLVTKADPVLAARRRAAEALTGDQPQVPARSSRRPRLADDRVIGFDAHSAPPTDVLSATSAAESTGRWPYVVAVVGILVTIVLAIVFLHVMQKSLNLGSVGDLVEHFDVFAAVWGGSRG